jgi:serine/threonine-protein kinase HipA
LSINGKRKDIDRRDLLSVAGRMNIKKADHIINEVRNAVAKWNEFAEDTHVKPEMRDAITTTLHLL